MIPPWRACRLKTDTSAGGNPQNLHARRRIGQPSIRKDRIPAAPPLPHRPIGFPPNPSISNPSVRIFFY
jgi:hypothetical protein